MELKDTKEESEGETYKAASTNEVISICDEINQWSGGVNFLLELPPNQTTHQPSSQSPPPKNKTTKKENSLSRMYPHQTPRHLLPRPLPLQPSRPHPHPHPRAHALPPRHTPLTHPALVFPPIQAPSNIQQLSREYYEFVEREWVARGVGVGGGGGEGGGGGGREELVVAHCEEGLGVEVG